MNERGRLCAPVAEWLSGWVAGTVAGTGGWDLKSYGACCTTQSCHLNAYIYPPYW